MDELHEYRFSFRKSIREIRITCPAKLCGAGIRAIRDQVCLLPASADVHYVVDQYKK